LGAPVPHPETLSPMAHSLMRSVPQEKRQQKKRSASGEEPL
jgi:hypothetical protein